MRQNSDPPLTPEQAREAQYAIKAKEEMDKSIASFSNDAQLKMWCVMRGIEACKSAPVWFNDKTNETTYYAVELARQFHKFLIEKGAP